MTFGHLMTSQLNELYRLIETSSSQPTEFARQFRPGETVGSVSSQVPTIVHVPTGSLFAFLEHPWGGHIVHYSPADGSRYHHLEQIEWNSVLAYFTVWLGLVNREDTTDLWGVLEAQAQPLSTVAESQDNTPFQPEERQRIVERLDKVLREVRRTQSLTKIQSDIVIDAVEDLKSASARVGRKDWLLIMLGTFASLVVGAVITAPEARLLLGASVSAFHSIIAKGDSKLRP
jgi:hypothetical protein